MNFPSEDFDQAVAAMCDGTIDAATMDQLTSLLKESVAAQDEYIIRTEMHHQLSTGIVPSQSGNTNAESEPGLKLTDGIVAFGPTKEDQNLRFKTFERLGWVAAAILIVGVITWQLLPEANQSSPLMVTVGNFTRLNNVTWEAHSFTDGDAIQKDQQIKLKSGSATIRLASGAELTVIGPASLSPTSDNSAYIDLGDITAVCETSTSKGFTITTPGLRAVDRGTRFNIKVNRDGGNHLKVLDGEVDLYLKNETKPRRIRKKEALSYTQGNSRVLTRLELGDSQENQYQFPTIAKPSIDDFADLASREEGKSRFTIMRGIESPDAIVRALTNGDVAPRHIKKQHFFFKPGTGGGDLILRLRSAIHVEKINCYSWFQPGTPIKHHYYLYGHPGPDGPASKVSNKNEVIPYDENDLTALGWERIVRVNSNDLYEHENTRDHAIQFVSSVAPRESGNASLGKYKYLLWRIKGDSSFSEFDVYGEP